MAELLLRNLPDQLIDRLVRRAAAVGISPEEAHLEILSDALEEPADFKEHLLAMPNVGEDWMFDRKDPRNQHPEREPLNLED